MKTSVKRGLLVAGVILGVVAIGAAVIVVRQANRAGEVLDQLAQPGVPQREIGVYVLEKDPAQTLGDTVGYAYGGVTDGDATAQLAAQALGVTPPWTSYPTAFALVDALEKGECQAVALEEAYQKSLADARGYEWTETGMRKVGSFQVDAEVEVPAAPQGTLDRFLVYLGGSDTFGDVSTLSRSDVNILAAVDVTQKKMALVATHRDFYVTFPKTGGAKDKLTHAGIYGVDASIDALERLYGVDVNYYLRVNFTGFTQIIDALGGVDVYSQYDFTAGGRQFSQGYNTVNGTEALSFARERYSFEDGDIQRGRNQMEVIRAVIKKAVSSSLLANYAAVMDAVSGSFETNMPQEKIAELVRMQLSDMASWNITTYTAAGQVSTVETYSAPGEMLSIVIPDEASVQEAKNMINSVLNGGE